MASPRKRSIVTLLLTMLGDVVSLLIMLLVIMTFGAHVAITSSSQ